ncbi:uncharacterized protein LTR77_004330 [Saxophila tyrrhenica]|uniref:NACHT-NTPase and P-loop NTPases N-terminal domain-containing protein n=1 Tax=Saxophila tyrrhenica TaxID=1690608 RepID=A0AAV9PDB0_9PEZI|nr:hypothetical protein LTR77_004330 [Saxophila tyrrhenica]
MAGGVGEAALILGLISIIIIVDETKKIYDAAHDKSGLPKVFREVHSRLPIVASILEEARRQNQSTQQFDTKIQPLLQSCEDDSKDLRTIFDKVISTDNVPSYERYSKAARAVKPGRTRKVESLMADILKNLQLLETHHLFKNVATAQELRSALGEMLKIEKEEPSLPDDPSTTIYSTGQGSNLNTGSGTQKIQQTFGAGPTWNVENYHAAQVVVTGLGGTGKTQLVLDFVENHKDDYDTVVWLNASSAKNLRSNFAVCCNELYLKQPAWSNSSSRIEDEPSVRAALQWSRRRREDQKWLVVLDNADDASQCPYDVVPKGVGGTLIITSREKASRLVDNKGETLEVDAMDLDEAMSLLFRSAGISEHKLRGSSLALPERIVEHLDRLPLAISLAGAAISDELLLDDDVEATLQKYFKDLEQHRDPLLKTDDSAGLSSYDKTIWTVWSSTFSAIEKLYPDVPAVQLLTFLTYADRSCIQHELFRLSAVEYSAQLSWEEVVIPQWLKDILAPEQTKDRVWDDHHYRETLKPLLRYGLVRSVNGPAGMKGITMHGLVRWRAQQQPDFVNYWAAYVGWMYLILRHDTLFTEDRPF